jgi:hypothetical protein
MKSNKLEVLLLFEGPLLFIRLFKWVGIKGELIKRENLQYQTTIYLILCPLKA